METKKINNTAMKKIILYILVSLFATAAYSQMPGYMGKRFSLGASLFVAPAINQQKTSDDHMTLHATVPYVHLKAGIDAEYAVSRKGILGFSYGLLINSLDLPYYVYDINGNNSYKHATLGTTTHYITFKYFGHRRYDDLVSPLGFFKGYELGVAIMSANDKDGLLPRSTGLPKKGTYATTVMPMFFYDLGYKRAFGKHLLLSTTVQIGISSMILSPLTSYYDYTDSYADINEGNVKYILRKRVNMQSVLSFQIGLSYLLF